MTEFKDFLFMASTAIGAGRSMKDAIAEAIPSLKNIHGSRSVLVRDLEKAYERMETGGENDINVLRDMAEMTGLEDVHDFVTIYSICKLTGASLITALNKAAAVIMEKMSIDREIEELKGMLLRTEDKMDKVLKNVANLLATNTNYATVVSAPQIRGNRLKFLQLSKVDESHILVVIVMEGNVIRNEMIQIDEPISEENMLKLNILLNTHLNGLALEEISLGRITALKEQAGIQHSVIIGNVIDALAMAIKGEEDLEVYTSGANNIFKYPELADQQRASELIHTFEEKKALAKLATDKLSEEGNTGIQVYIGEEAPIDSMKDCSVVTATYELEEGMRGSIAIIGPKRMDYDKVVSSLKTMMKELERVYKKE